MLPCPIDLETWPIQPGRPAPKPVAVGTDKIQLWKDWKGFSHGNYVGCFVPFDLACIGEYRPQALEEIFEGLERGRFADITVREQLSDIAKGVGTKREYSLQAIAKRRLGKDIEKEDTPRLSYWKVDEIPVDQWPEAYRRYLTLDLELPLEIWEHQEKEGNPNAKFEAFETECSFCLYLMSCWGIRADKVWVQQLIKDADASYKKLCAQFREIGVMREDGSKDKKAMQALVSKAYNGKPPRTDKGAIKTDRLTLEESEDPLLELLTGDGPVEKIVTTYGKVLEEAAERPYNSRYKVLVSSGRTSGNFQQWPRGGPNAPDVVNRLRAGFVPRPGFLLCSVDITAAELGSLAEVQLSTIGWSEIAKALNLEQDLHIKLTTQMTGKSYDEMAALVKAKDPQAKNLRQAAKAPNFGLPGMMGCHRLVLSAHKDGARFCELLGLRKECGGSKCKQCHNAGYDLMKAHGKAYPCVAEYHRWLKKQHLDPFKTPITGFIRGGLFPSEAANHPFQHLTSRAAKFALIRTQHDAYRSRRGSPLYGSRPVVFAHDEIIAEVPVATAHEAAMELAKVVREATQSTTPSVKVKAEAALMRRWWKNAEPVFENGRLVPWKPS